MPTSINLIIKETRSLAGDEPFSLAFSPQGDRIAVAYYTASQVQIFDGYNLRLLYEPDITGATERTNNLEVVSFSNDGRFLMAGGDMALKKEGKWWYQIRVWDQAGKGTFSDYSACTDGVMDIKPLPDGSFAYCGTQPDFGRFTNTGTRVFYKKGEINSYNARDRSHLKVNYDGSQIGIKPFGKEALSFDLNKRELLK